MTEQEDFAKHVDLTQDGIVETLVRAGRSPVLVPHQLDLPRDGVLLTQQQVYCHIPPAGTIFRDTLVVNGGDIEFYNSNGESRGRTVLRILKPEVAEIVKERRNAELRKVSRERREAQEVQAPKPAAESSGGIR